MLLILTCFQYLMKFLNVIFSSSPYFINVISLYKASFLRINNLNWFSSCNAPYVLFLIVLIFWRKIWYLNYYILIFRHLGYFKLILLSSSFYINLLYGSNKPYIINRKHYKTFILWIKLKGSTASIKFSYSSPILATGISRVVSLFFLLSDTLF